MTREADTLRTVWAAIVDHVQAVADGDVVLTGAVVAYETLGVDNVWHGSYFVVPPTTSPATSIGLLAVAEASITADLAAPAGDDDPNGAP